MINFIIGLFFLGILVFVHELGHFLIAKWRKVKVESFSIGFGPVILSKKIGETEYRLSLLPFGGYVKMAGESIDEAKGKEWEFQSKKVWERMAIAFAGPAFNILFAIFVLWIAYMIGTVELPDKIVIGSVEDTTLSKIIESGDEIIKVNNKKIKSWEKLLEEVALYSGDSIPITIKKKNGEILNLKVKVLKEKTKQNIELKYIPIYPAGDVLIVYIKKNSPAQKVGLKKGDIIKEINNIPVASTKQFIDLMKNFKDSVKLTILREEKLITYKIKPDTSSGRPIIGIKIIDHYTQKVRYGPIKSFIKSLEKNWDITLSTFKMLKILFSGQVGIKAMAGPVGIAKITGDIAHFGISEILFFLALISINLALVNLLPLVITDGGIIMFLIIELILGRPVNEKIQIILQTITTYILIGFLILITFFDIQRLLGK